MWVMLCTAALFLYLIYEHFKIRRMLKNYPPGPPRLPVLGSLLSVPGSLIHLQAERWRGEYGNVVGLLLGHKPLVMVRGLEEVTAILKNEHCQARPDDFTVRHRSFNKRLGIFFTDGQYWTEQRRYVVRHLRDLGFGKVSLEGVILHEVEETLQFMEKTGPIVKPNQVFNVPVLNVLWWMVTGKPFASIDDVSDPRVDLVARVMRNKNTNTAPCSIWPFLRYVAPEWSGYNELFPPTFELLEFLRGEVESKLKADKCDGSLMSVYIRMVHEGKAPSDSFSTESLMLNCFDLLLAGGESTANTLSFALLYMCLNPDVQDKAHRELDEVLGRGKAPVFTDRPRLPYLEAVISEVMRINPIAPVTPPHRCTADVQLNGYTLPKGTMCVVSLYSIMNDKERWGDPENFRPERFLDAEGRHTPNPLQVPFGLGKRVCIGEPLVHQAMFLFLGGLLSRFHFAVPPGHPEPSTMPVPGFTVTPQPYETLAERRA